MIRIFQLVVAAVLALLACAASAFEIVESRFRVEVEPGKFADQAVLRCADGEVITVPWEVKFADACGEDLFGNVTRRGGKGNAVQGEGQPRARESGASQTQNAAQAAPSPSTELETTGGTPALLDPASREVLKQYERCRKARKPGVKCAAERDQALAALATPKTAAAPANATQPQLAPANPPAEAPQSPVVAAPAATPKAPGAAPLASPAPAVDEQRAAAEAKIAEEYTWCMRLKPKLECEQARAKAIAALDKPKGKGAKRKRAPDPEVSADSSVAR